MMNEPEMRHEDFDEHNMDEEMCSHASCPRWNSAAATPCEECVDLTSGLHMECRSCGETAEGGDKPDEYMF